MAHFQEATFDTVTEWKVKNTFIQLNGSSRDDLMASAGAMHRQQTDSVLESKLWRSEDVHGLPTVDSLPDCDAWSETSEEDAWEESASSLVCSSTGHAGLQVFEPAPALDWSEEVDDACSNPVATAAKLDVHPNSIDGLTTMMLRNVPVHYSQSRLMQEINRAGFLGCFDFFYLPMEGRSRQNRGFAFLNFETCDCAKRFFERFHGKSLQKQDADVLSVFPADLQGFEANARRYANTRPDRREQSQPVFFKPLPKDAAAAVLPATRQPPSSQDVGVTDDVVRSAAQHVANEVLQAMQQALGEQQQQQQQQLWQQQQHQLWQPTQWQWPQWQVAATGEHCGSGIVGFSPELAALSDGFPAESPVGCEFADACKQCGATKSQHHRFCGSCGAPSE